ncbi:MBL fold metallo-hydrolase [bacterium]|nr:MBL fold metallo-hydrolase [bacterium]
MKKTVKIILFIVFIFFIHLAIAKDLEITVIYDNNPYNKELETRWGFSCLVEGLKKTILFDVGGDGSVLLGNMEKLKINPEKVDIVILSHIHYDHIGGLFDFLKENSNVSVYIPKSFPQSIKDRIKNTGAKFVEVHHPVKIVENAYSTGELGTGIKEESLVIKTSKGLVVITGCAHPGIVNIVRKAKEMFKTNIYLILGGFHLSGMNGWQIERIIKGIKNENVEKVAPCHCSGDLARKLFKKAYGENFILTGCGKKIKIKNAF